MVYYILRNQHRIGPLIIEELSQMKVSKDTLVWYEGLSEWTKAGELLELLDIIIDNKKSTKTPINELFSAFNFWDSSYHSADALQLLKAPYPNMGLTPGTY